MRRPAHWLLIATILFISGQSACSKTDDAFSLNRNGYWTVGNNTYSRDSSSQMTYPDIYRDIPDFFVYVEVHNKAKDQGSGRFPGSTIWFVFPNHLGPGRYKVSGLSYSGTVPPGTKWMYIICNIGLDSDKGGLTYITVDDAGTADVKIDKEGQYHISTVNDVMLRKDVDLGEEDPDAADSYLLKVDNAY